MDRSYERDNADSKAVKRDPELTPRVAVELRRSSSDCPGGTGSTYSPVVTGRETRVPVISTALSAVPRVEPNQPRVARSRKASGCVSDMCDQFFLRGPALSAARHLRAGSTELGVWRPPVRGEFAAARLLGSVGADVTGPLVL